jgi:hypothetical protein
MKVEFDSVLENCLDRLVQGETLQACLSRYPEHAAELEPLLSVATRVKRGAQLRPSPAFKTRARAQLHAHMNAHPRKPRRLLPHFPPIFRLALSTAVLLLAFATTGMALAQFSLPGDVLYPLKLSSESAWRTISPDPVGVDLDLGNRRIDEALAVSSNATAQEVALREYQKVITDLTQYQDSSVQERITEGLKAQQERLKGAGLKLPKQDDQDDLPVSIP